MVTRLERRDWVRREPMADNGRVTMARLTEAGYAKVVASAPDHVLVRTATFCSRAAAVATTAAAAEPLAGAGAPDAILLKR